MSIIDDEKKAFEKNILYHFLERLPQYRCKKIREHENPDFILELENGEILGVEICRYGVEGADREQHFNMLIKKLNGKTKKDTFFSDLSISLEPSFQKKFPKNLDEVADEIIAEIKSNFKNEIIGSFRLKNEYIKNISVHMGKERISTIKSGWCDGDYGKFLCNKIITKSKKIKANQTCEKNILIFYYAGQTGCNPTSTSILKKNFLSDIKHQFSEIYIYIPGEGFIAVSELPQMNG